MALGKTGMDGAAFTFRPIPKTAWVLPSVSTLLSTKIPPALAPSMSTSLGHLSRASMPAIDTIARATPTPARMLSKGASKAFVSSRADSASAAPGMVIHCRPKRPLPAPCSSAITTSPCVVDCHATSIVELAQE